MIGIIIAIKISLPLFVLAACLLITIVTFIILYFFKNKKFDIIIGFSINLFFIFFGMLLTKMTAISGEINDFENLKTKKGLIIGEISKDPKLKEKNVVLNIDIFAIKTNDVWQRSDGKTILYIENDSLSQKLNVGDKIIFNPQLQEIENSGNPLEFDYKKYLSFRLINSSAFIKSNDWKLLENRDIKFNFKILKFRIQLINILKQSGLENDELAVMSALALGYSDNLSAEVLHNYTSSGAMHILSVSGLHVGIIYGIITFLFSFIKNKKFENIKTIFIIILIWFYACLTSLSPPVARASLMFSIIAVGRFQKNKPQTLNVVALSAFILLIFNPFYLFDVGFQLSYIAVVGILILQQPIQNLYTAKTKLGKWIWSLTAVSIAAQIATAPLCIYYFNQFSNFFLLTNYILIPVSTVAIWLCVFVFIFSWWNLAASFLGKILSFVVKIMNYSANLVDKMPFSVSENLYIDFTQMIIFYFIIIFLFIFFFHSKKYKHLILGICFIIVFVSINLFQNISTHNQKFIVVYNINKTTAINIIDNKKNILFANFDVLDKEKFKMGVKSFWLQKGIASEKYIDLSSSKNNILSNIINIDSKNIFYKNKFIVFEDKKLFVLDNSFCKNRQDVKIDVDFIVLSNNPDIKISELSLFFNFKKIIIDSSNYLKTVENWLSEENIEKEKIYNVKTDGAFVFELKNIKK